MTTKRTTKRKPLSAALKARAQAIIDGPYDEDTRESIRYMLKTNAADLADFVKDAEKGITICDTIMVQAKQRQAAREVAKMLAGPKDGFPLWFREAIAGALVAAAKERGIEPFALIDRESTGFWRGPNQDAAKLIENLFTRGRLDRTFEFTPVLTDKQRVIDAVEVILHNPQTPGDLHEKVCEFVVETVNQRGEHDSLFYDMPMLACVIAAHPENELMGNRPRANADAQ